MDFFQREEIFGWFEPGAVTLETADTGKHPIVSITAQRDGDAHLCIQLTRMGWVERQPDCHQPGEIYEATAALLFEHLANAAIVARQVVHRGTELSSGFSDLSRSIETYTAHTIEIDCRSQQPATYTIEWVANLPETYIWPNRTPTNATTSFSRDIGIDEPKLRLTATSRKSNVGPVLSIEVDGIRVYLLQGLPRDPAKRLGQIVYQGCPSVETRKRIRLCLSFALGRPIIYVGHTDYDDAWQPTWMAAHDAVSIGGAMFKLHDSPPYPIFDRHVPNIISETMLNRVVGALYARYDDLRFEELSWSYWYAVCAPPHITAVHFGSLVEKMQRSSAMPFKADRNGLLAKDAWKKLQSAIHEQLKTMNLSDDISRVLKNKILSLNQLPQNLALQRLLDQLELKVGEAEIGAWKHRHMAAHGAVDKDLTSIILNARLLKLLFHRILACITSCSESYIDYYNLGFPERSISEAVSTRAITRSEP